MASSKLVKDMTLEERVGHFGYDPLGKLEYIGATDKSYEYRHPDGHTHSGRFEFYYNRQTGAIDVCHLGCNGRIFTGRQISDGEVTFDSAYGYPNAETFAEEFKILRDKFLGARK